MVVSQTFLFSMTSIVLRNTVRYFIECPSIGAGPVLMISLGLWVFEKKTTEVKWHIEDTV